MPPLTENIFYAALKCMQILIACEVGLFLDKAAYLLFLDKNLVVFYQSKFMS